MMKKLILGLITFTMLLSFEVNGLVSNATTGEFISNVEIEIWSTENGGWHHSHHSVTTNENGEFVFSDIEMGEYVLFIWKDGFYSDTIELTIVSDESIEILLTPFSDFGFISGYVIDEDTNHPIPHSLIDVIPNDTNGVWISTYSDENGYYGIAMPEGDYIVSCSIERDHGGNFNNYDYIEFYDDVNWIEDATIISVIDESTITGIDFIMPTPIEHSETSHFQDILNGHHNNYINFHEQTGLGIINYITIDIPEEGSNIGDEIGILDSNGSSGIGECDDPIENSSIFVGAGVYEGNTMIIPVFGSIVDCEISDQSYPGFLDGNEITLIYWDSVNDEETEINAIFSFGSPTPNSGGTPFPNQFGNQIIYATITLLDINTELQNNNYNLSSAYPNPFNPSTTIEYAVVSSADVSIIVYDMMGREVTTLVSGNHSPNNYSVIWDATDCTSGIYFVKFQTDKFLQTQKLMLIK
jgi:hypothetical protein